MRTARANARLAMVLAIGDLQKKLGPDQRISAPASLVERDAPLGVTGAWSASLIDELGKDYDAKEDKFLGWLASSSLKSDREKMGDLPYESPGDEDTALLLGNGSLGNRETLKSDDMRIAAHKAPVKTGKIGGSIAWMTFDESVKSRMDLYDARTLTEPIASMARAGSAARDGVFALDQLESVKPDAAQSGRMVSLETAVLVTGADELPAYRPDLTTWSVSLQTDPVTGGLKKDLSSLFSRGLSADEAKLKLYAENELQTGDSDPSMGLLAGYHDLYKKLGVAANNVSPGPGAVAAQVPRSYRPTIYDRATKTEKPNRLPPPSPILVPSIVRVDIIFSLVTRDVHGGRAGGLRASGFPYMLHLMYLPVVTLHNPYDVPLVFESMKVSFKDIPIGFQYLVNNRPLTTGMVPLNSHYVGKASGRTSKEFGITLKSSTGRSRQKIRMEPGQTKLFGTPKVPPTWTWADEKPGAGADGIHLFDWRSDKTANFNLAPKLITQSTTTACGFDVDWLQPRGMQTSTGKTHSGGEGIVALRGSESIGVRFGPVAQPSNSFSISMELVTRNRGTSAGAVTINYGDVGRLTEIVEEGTSLRFPDPRSFPATFPERGVDGTIRVRDIYEPNSRPVKDYVAAKPFAIFSLSGRTTLESFVPSRPFADSSPIANLAAIDLQKGKEAPGDQPYELVMMPIRNNTSVIEELRATEEGYFFGGHGALRGTPRSTFYEFPRLPLQSLAQFRHANLASSGLHPFTTYTVGESRAHPMLPSDGVHATNPADGTDMLDHTWLANSALWDSYFLSTIADYTGGDFGTAGKDVESVRTDFLSGKGTLLNGRMVSFVHEDEAQDVAAKLDEDDGWLAVARYLGVKGGFNVNSTSVDAWIAVLSGMRDQELMTDEGTTQTGEYSAFPRVRRPSGKGIDGQPVMVRQLSWQGFRQLDEAQIERLAGLIVEEIRERGPFLSLSEFVNRRLGSASDERSLRGALEAAIVKSGVNDLMVQDGLELDIQTMGKHDYLTPEAAFGQNTAGAPGELSQGDLLSALGSHLTVRGDTFIIRSYGEAGGANGGPIMARAWCETVVQRVPAFIDPADSPETEVTALNDTNRRFGRRFKIVSFRWLASDEI